MTRSWYPHYKRTHPQLPLPLSARPRAKSLHVQRVRVSVHIVPCSLLREPLATNRSIHVQNVIQQARVVARKRVSTKIPAFSPRLTRPFHRLSTTMACLLVGRQRLLR